MLVLNDEWFCGRVVIMSKNQSDIIPMRDGLSRDALTIDSLIPKCSRRSKNRQKDYHYK